MIDEDIISHSVSFGLKNFQSKELVLIHEEIMIFDVDRLIFSFKNVEDKEHNFLSIFGDILADKIDSKTGMYHFPYSSFFAIIYNRHNLKFVNKRVENRFNSVLKKFMEFFRNISLYNFNSFNKEIY